jgi:hypothetical protein
MVKSRNGEKMLALIKVLLDGATSALKTVKRK